MGEARGGERVTRSRKGARRTPAVRKAARPAAVRGATPDRMAMGKDDLLFEIGVEELPASYVAPALEQMEHLARTALEELRLSCARLETLGTPRRLALVVRGVAVRQTDIEEEIQGPASRVAFDAEGRPTPALLGFCRGKGVDPAAVRRVKTPKGEYVAATIRHVGQPAALVLPKTLASVATRLQFPKSMRWIAANDTRFARPVRWLVALLGGHTVPVRAFALEAGRSTRGHRFLHPRKVELSTARDYARALERARVLVEPRRRARRLKEQLDHAARRAGGRAVADPALVEINNFLVEWPTVFAGRFDAGHLKLPREVIVTALREHQRFFAVEDGEGRLLPMFLAVRNGSLEGIDQVRKGAEDVLAARLEDARFYWETDLKHPPWDRIEQLGGVVWMEGLGTLRDKATRLESLAGWLAERIAPEAAVPARRAALLCKTDLLSEMIGSGKEYASLEGVIGSYYARVAGEPEPVAAAIAEHYRPRGPADALPVTPAGVVLSLADKLDHVAGAFVAGKVPSGSEDPYGVRRAGNGVVRVLVEQQRHLDLREATMETTQPFFARHPELPHATIVKKLGEFWRGRVEAALEDRDIPYDTREAALEAQVQLNGARPRPGWIDPWDCHERAGALAGFRGDRRFEPLVILFKRVANILKAATEPLPEALDRARLAEDAERALLEALETARRRTDPLWRQRAYREILPALLDMEAAIHGFFDRVLVNAEDAPTRLNRLRLLTEVRALFVRGWDLSRVVVEGERG
ncbi:MAG: glycine--tRNA ligase subunit beta [Candidatus Eisenbacteria bacterium]|uniref:Glycine--tRNA ligase beta subunit n=1 Tax=Eiseniibacteriota bacterium TaxID=2212470 RepID=A0A538TVT1_UNCEI|nr:MAG: glycine--tRNA ligase subunit beta [Candidatus Eisenbacteria bacterium]